MAVLISFLLVFAFSEGGQHRSGRRRSEVVRFQHVNLVYYSSM